MIRTLRHDTQSRNGRRRLVMRTPPRFDLKARLPPQAKNALVIDRLPRVPQRLIDFSDAPAGMAFCNRLHLRQKRRVLLRSGPVLDAGAVDDGKDAGPSLEKALLLQKGDQLAASGQRGYFFCRKVCRASTSRSRSASRRLRRAFSCSSVLRRRASSVLLPLNLLRQR